MDRHLSDVVWAGTDAFAGGLAARTRRLVALAAVVVLALTGAVHWLATSGLFTPRLEPGLGWGPSTYVYADGATNYVFNEHRGPSNRISFTFGVHNAGALDVEILQIGESLPGLRLTATKVGDLHWVPATGWTTGGRLLTSEEPHLLESRTGVTVELEYIVDDCAARPAGRQPIPVRAVGVFGEQTVWITLPPAHFEPGDGWSTAAGENDPFAVDWAGHLAVAACLPHRE